ncbi:class I SAM-dependent methyltransferase [Clostridium ljungdahlii]|uniref:Putative methyltransferase with a HTH motif n=1 Tax=Clostridium ljungdahlii (strain ATCC 55383 / DSM 13528 / PETC) TaxID=748727 RepID=D8GKI9_CLOLD|nr:class I SAM-dependent methyltransferase [Clostridium ljungdahlii]ADK15329.1 putative methyltransferase with a HTH motif [Clostridium ljungdahlii DSM 13528]OAA88427.1 Ubiquinone/menaquinone biosynthesis C-methyltransferase UbiE [Clostridium ljungdahlii DSM 13528]
MQDKEFFNEVAEKWDTMCCHPREKVDHVIESIGLTEGEKVLDIGSGTGIVIPYLEKKVGKSGSITALDIAGNMIQVSKRKNKYLNLNFQVADFLEYESSKSYDCIVAYSCYPHFKNKEKFFEKSYSLLKSGGKLVIAHIESKDVINLRHSKIEDKLDSNTLVDIEKLAEFAQKRGFVSSYTQDDSEFYIYVGKKS